jgi:ABC-type uncharacterized transport system ATPase subunit
MSLELEEILSLSDRILVLFEGKIVARVCCQASPRTSSAISTMIWGSERGSAA